MLVRFPELAMQILFSGSRKVSASSSCVKCKDDYTPLIAHIRTPLAGHQYPNRECLQSHHAAQGIHKSIPKVCLPREIV